jgi:hypothetical protein
MLSDIPFDFHKLNCNHSFSAFREYIEFSYTVVNIAATDLKKIMIMHYTRELLGPIILINLCYWAAALKLLLVSSEDLVPRAMV